MPDKTLDTKGLACPLPILKTKKALSELPKGAKLEVLATDPGSAARLHRLLQVDRQCARSSTASRAASTASSSSTDLPRLERRQATWHKMAPVMAKMRYRVLGAAA